MKTKNWQPSIRFKAFQHLLFSSKWSFALFFNLTINYFRNGNFLEHYKGPQSAAGFYHAVVSANHGEEQETDCKIINKMKKKDKSFTIVFFGPKDHPFYENIYLKMYEELKTDAS